MQSTVWGERSNHRVPIERHVHSADEEVEAAREFLDCRGIPARHDVVRSKTLCLLEFAFVRCERGHVAAVSGGEFYSQVSQPADADNAHPTGRLRMHRKWCEDG